MKIPELLAPVGGTEALAAAVQNGADAVYLGGRMFSARQYAENFDRYELQKAIDYSHIRGVKVYVTVNTLLTDPELPAAGEYLKFLYESGADAVIIQDLGLARAARQLVPGLALHASTQMTVHNSAGVELLLNQGFSRVVLARELSLREIAEIKRRTGAEIEVFVHGALCISYSGQCLMSSMIGGRSGNRGRCAQPCRMEYSLVDAAGRNLAEPGVVGSHLLSPKDLNMISHIPQLAEAGISALKIEGRMKRPEYVATVTRIYREALDRYREAPQNYTVNEKEIKDLTQIFNRGFTTGYFFGRPGRDMMSYKRPNNRGLYLGRVAAADRAGGTAEILLEESLCTGDGIEFWVTEGGRRGVVVNHMVVNGQETDSASAGDRVLVPSEGRVKPGDRVFKTHDAGLISLAEKSYKSAREIKKIPLRFKVEAGIGEHFTVTVTEPAGCSFSAQSGTRGQAALKKPLTPDSLEKQLNRLGNTPYSLGSLEADIDSGVMVPLSEINETRRRAVEGLSEKVAASYRREVRGEEFAVKLERLIHETGDFGVTAQKPDNLREGTQQADMELAVSLAGMELLKAAVRGGADVVYFGCSRLGQGKAETFREMEQALDVCRKNGVKMAVSTPRIVKEHEMKKVIPLLEFALIYRLPVLIGNLGTLMEAARYRIPEIYTDFSLNIFNSQAVRWLKETCDAARVAVSPELTLKQVGMVSRNGGLPLEAAVQGHLTLMVTEHCTEGSLLGGMSADTKCGRPCRHEGHRGLKDRMDFVFPLTHDKFCRTYIHNAKELSMIEDIYPLYRAGVSRLRVEISIEDPARTAAVTRCWRDELDRFAENPGSYRPAPGAREKIAALSPAGLTKGHYYRGVE